MKTLDEIISKIIALTGLKNDSELAKVLHVKPNTINNWRSRNSMSHKEMRKLVTFCEQRRIDLDELFTGRQKPAVSYMPTHQKYTALLPTDVWMVRLLEDLVYKLVEENIIKKEILSEEHWGRIEFRKNLRKRKNTLHN